MLKKKDPNIRPGHPTVSNSNYLGYKQLGNEKGNRFAASIGYFEKYPEKIDIFIKWLIEE